MSNKLEENELKKVVGGAGPGGGHRTHCENCNSVFDYFDANKREIEKGCSTVTQYECPDCHHWN